MTNSEITWKIDTFVTSDDIPRHRATIKPVNSTSDVVELSLDKWNGNHWMNIECATSRFYSWESALRAAKMAMKIYLENDR